MPHWRWSLCSQWYLLRWCPGCLQPIETQCMWYKNLGRMELAGAVATSKAQAFSLDGALASGVTSEWKMLLGLQLECFP